MILAELRVGRRVFDEEVRVLEQSIHMNLNYRFTNLRLVDGAKYLLDQVIAEQGFHEFDFPTGDPALIDESTFEGGKFTYFAGHTVDSLSLAVQHRNMVVIIILFGFESSGEVTQEFAVEMMNKIISKIDKVELHQEWVE